MVATRGWWWCETEKTTNAMQRVFSDLVGGWWGERRAAAFIFIAPLVVLARQRPRPPAAASRAESPRCDTRSVSRTSTRPHC